jgi:hypothetical protein
MHGLARTLRVLMVVAATVLALVGAQATLVVASSSLRGPATLSERAEGLPLEVAKDAGDYNCLGLRNGTTYNVGCHQGCTCIRYEPWCKC